MSDPDPAVPPYPPPRHALSLLGVDIEAGPGTDATGWMTVRPDTTTAPGTPGLGAVATLLDIVAGASAVMAATPDYIFTADMSVHLVPGVRTDVVVTRAHVRRRGRRTLVQEISLRTPSGEPVGWGTTTFVIARRPPDVPDLRDHHPDGRYRFWPPGDDDAPPRFLEELGLRHDGPGQVSVDLRWEVANNIGALNGGVQGVMIEQAAASLGRVHLGATAATTDAHIAFLEPGLASPLRARATLVGAPAPEGDRMTVEVELLDADDTLCTYATTEVVIP